jgi:hypothetical protein
MSKLSDNWISEGWIDYEYKKYLLLGYLQSVNEQFKEVKLYPPLAELIRHYERLKNFNDTKQQLKLGFPKDLKGMDLEKKRLEYQQRLNDDELMQELHNIVEFALPKFKKHIEEGKSIYEFIESNLEIAPVGITPIYQREGYAMLTFDSSKEVYVYRYTINLFQNSADKFRGIALQFVKTVRQSLVNTFQRIKLDLISSFADLPNPPAWRIHSSQHIPLEESFVPVSKRLLLKTVEA